MSLRERVPLLEPTRREASVGPPVPVPREPARTAVPRENTIVDAHPGKNLSGAAAVVGALIEDYRKARLTFVTEMNKLARKTGESGKDTVQAILDQDVLALLCAPLVQDTAPSVRFWTMHTLEAMSEAAPAIPETLARAGVMKNMLPSLSHKVVKVREATLEALLQVVSVGGGQNAMSLVSAGALPLLANQLEFFDTKVRELAIRVISSIVCASEGTAVSAATPAILDSLVGNLGGHDVTDLKEAAVSTLADFAGTNDGLAELVQDARAIPAAVALSKEGVPPHLRASALRCLAQMSRHNDELATACADAGAVGVAVTAVVNEDPRVRASAAKLALMLCRRTLKLAKTMMDAGACAALVRCLSSNHQSAAPEAIDSCAALGHLAAADSDFAAQVVRANGVTALAHGLTSKSKELQTAGSWSLGKVATASASCARTLAERNVHEKLRALALKQVGSRTPAMEEAGLPPAPAPEGDDAEVMEALGRHASECLLTIARTSDHQPTLMALCRMDVPWDVVRDAAASLARLLAPDPAGRRDLVATGALKRLAELARMCVAHAERAAVMDARNADRGVTPEGVNPLDQGAWPDAEAVAKRQLLVSARSIFGMYTADVLSHYQALGLQEADGAAGA